MSEKWQFVYKGHPIKITEAKDHWVVHFEDGQAEKLFYHVNDAKEGIWMWESGRIDESSRSIGALLESAKQK